MHGLSRSSRFSALTAVPIGARRQRTLAPIRSLPSLIVLGASTHWSTASARYCSQSSLCVVAQACRIIGFAPNQAHFARPPHLDGCILPLVTGENVEIVAIASQAVFRFVCTVEAVCQLPFDYIVLSKPGAFRRLRQHKSIRVRAHLAVRYGPEPSSDTYEGLGLAQDIGALSMSLATSWALGQVGDRLRVACRLLSTDLDTPIETSAIIGNVQKGTAPGDPTTQGRESDQIDSAQQMAMKTFVFDRQDDALYWTHGAR
jgi:hypothetical protein